jgi:hypothetical protein
MEIAKILAVYCVSPPVLVVEAEDGTVARPLPHGAEERRPSLERWCLEGTPGGLSTVQLSGDAIGVSRGPSVSFVSLPLPRYLL